MARRRRGTVAPHARTLSWSPSMYFLSFLLLIGIAYMLWRIMDQLPDVVFRLSEIQRDMAEIRRSMQEPPAAPAPPEAPADAGGDDA
jgi:hypothetical protein